MEGAARVLGGGEQRPQLVARTIVSAVESRRPLRRYLVGADALAIAVSSPLVAESISDGATRLLSGLGGSIGSYL